MITVENTLLGTKENTLSIIKGTPLGNPFKVGDQNAVTGAFILDKVGVQKAYHDWLVQQLKLENPVVIDALDEIAWDIMDGKMVILKCTCGSEYCHGFILKHILEVTINEQSRTAHQQRSYHCRSQRQPIWHEGSSQCL